MEELNYVDNNALIQTLTLLKVQIDEAKASGGVSDYNELINRPILDGTLISGTLTKAGLNIATTAQLATKANASDVTTQIATALSTANDYTDTQIEELPIASPTNNGLMPKESFSAITDIEDRLTSLEGGEAKNYIVSFTSDTPSQSEIQGLYETASGKTGTPIEGTKLYDTSRDLTAEWYTTSNSWVVFGGSSLPPTATNTTLGVVKGSTLDGKSFAEQDGTLSVNGWDVIKADIANKLNTSDLIPLTSSQVQTIFNQIFGNA